MSDLHPVKKILILSANPKETTPLRLGEEIREIKEGLKRAKRREQFIIETAEAVRYKDIRRAILDYEPQILHFSGHGIGSPGQEMEHDSGERKLSPVPEYATESGGLVFEDETGHEKLVDAEALAGLFELFADQLECVVLNACYSEVQARAIAQHIPYVIGMNRDIGDGAAIEFAVGFYDALGAGRPVEFAYQLGCNAIQIAGIAEHLTPVLLQPPEAGAPPSSLTTLQPATSAMTSNSASQRIDVFFSYAHEDEELRNELTKHLKLLERQGVISAWYDRDITAGEEWKPKILEKLNQSQLILLLISADFLASDFCWGVELQRAMERHEAKEARVIPIILREVDWKGAPFGKLQALPKNAEPVTNWSNRDQAFANIARGIRRAVEDLTEKKP